MNLHPEQIAAVQHVGKKCVVLSGAGSGKTEVIARRVEFLAARTPGAKLVVITFTVNAAKELRERLDRYRVPEGALAFVGTIHGYCADLLRKHGHMIGLRLPFTICTESLRERVMLRAVSECMATAKKSAALAYFRGETEPTGDPVIKAVIARYERLLKESRLVTYGQLIEFTTELLTNHSPPVACDHLLVDEAQDCSADEWALFDAIGGEKTFVGSPHQCIYAFKGATPERLLGCDNCTFFSLAQNRRSAPEIVHASNRLLSASQTVFVPSQPAKLAQGIVMVRSFAADTSELVAAVTWAKAIVAKGGTPALLTRTNWQAERVRTALRDGALNANTAKEARPAFDISMMEAVIAFNADPNNEAVADWLLSLAFPPTMQAAIRSRQTERLESLAAAKELRGFLKPMTEIVELFRALCLLQDLCAWLHSTIEGLPQFSNYLDLQAVLRDDRNQKSLLNGVYVGTMHSVKGMEFDAVWCLHWNEENFGFSNDKETEESRRLAYVAMTRARSELVLSYSNIGRLNEWSRDNRPMQPCRFFAEAGI